MHTMPKSLAGLLAALAAQAAMAANIDFGGYLRSGEGTSSKGGNNVCFRVNGDSAFDPGGYAFVDNVGRLGNQCDTYGEIKLGTTMGEAEGTKFGVHTLVAYGTQQVADYEQTTPAFREAYGTAEGFGNGMFAKSTVWVGKRYYNRKDVHIVDLFTLEVSGPGAGFENIDFGFGKFSYALMKTGNANYQNTAAPSSVILTGPNAGQIVGTDGQTIGRVTLVGDETQQKTNHDLRLEGINLGKAGSLGVGTNIIRGNNTDATGNNFNGTSFWAAHSIVLFGSVQNGLMVETAQGSGSLNGAGLWWANSNSGNGQPHSMYHGGWRVIETTNFEFGDHVNGATFLGYGREHFPWFGIGSTAGSDRTTLSLVVRPVYHFSEIYSIAVEGGTTHVTGYNLNYDGNPASTTNHLNKLTIAPQLSMGSGFYARPALRAYVTFARWNKGGAHACTGRDCATLVLGTFDNVTSATTYGFQMEAWW